MNIEEKAKHYDIALDKIKRLLGTGSSCSREELEYIFPELKESEDEKIRKHLIFLFEKFVTLGVANECETSEIKVDDILAWLEKQGEQKPADVDYISGIRKELLSIENNAENVVGLTESQWVAIRAAHRLLGEYNTKEQKPADKVEPKFKKGDWVVFNNKHQSIYQVEKIEDGYYILRHTHGGTFRVCVLHDESLRLWTIADAKPGDVLHSPSHRLIWIYKDNKHYHTCVNMNYVTENVATDGLIIIPNDTCPATNDERTILLSNLEKSGYEWDAEHKQLKKTEQNPTNEVGNYNHKEVLQTIINEQKPAWSEEDEAIYYGVIETEQYMLDVVNGMKKFAVGNISIKEECTRELNWLKSIKDRVQPKQEWNEEDEPQKELAETYLAVFDKKFPILPTLKGKQLADYKNFLNKCQQIFGLKYWGIRPLQAKLFEKLSLLWVAWGAEHLKGLGQTNGDTDNEKQEWSEEDKRIIDNLVSQLGNLYARKLIKEETKDKYVDWLKSLRPNSQWKPSDEQMKTLEIINITGSITEPHEGEVMISLYNDLKKLK